MTSISPEEEKKQLLYRDARRTGEYDDIWQSVGKCVFCDLRDKYIFHEENGIVMTVSLYAYIDGQFMIIPRRHIRSVKELTELEWETVRKFMYIAKKIIREVHAIKGTQFLIRDGGIQAQSTVDQHLHIQCIPFDAPDLSVWNYRQLKHTPLENADLYKKLEPKIIKHSKKFTQKYKNQTVLPVHSDAIITNAANEVLFIERSQATRLEQNYITQPGGRVDTIATSLEEELCREVEEEVGLKIKPADLSLVNSQIDHVTYAGTPPIAFLRNSYIVNNLSLNIILTPGEECNKILWVPVQKIPTHPNISPETKTIILKVLG